VLSIVSILLVVLISCCCCSINLYRRFLLARLLARLMTSNRFVWSRVSATGDICSFRSFGVVLCCVDVCVRVWLIMMSFR